MNVLEVSREDWPTFLDEFSRRWRGLTATVDRQPPEMIAERIVERSPLQAVNVIDGGSAMEIVAGDGKDRWAHRVERPVRMLFAEAVRGASAAIQIECAGNSAMLIHVRNEREMWQ